MTFTSRIPLPVEGKKPVVMTWVLVPVTVQRRPVRGRAVQFFQEFLDGSGMDHEPGAGRKRALKLFEGEALRPAGFADRIVPSFSRQEQ
jgi:hypothetical protein